MTKIKNFNSYIEEQLTIDEFFYSFYNFPKGTFSGYSHEEIKQFFPFVKRVGFEDVNREKILKGEVLLVKDINNKVLIYQNPFAVCKDEDEYSYDELMDFALNNENIHVIFTVEDNIDELEKFEQLEKEDVEKLLRTMSNYELGKMSKDAKKSRKYRLSRLVQKELWFRPENHNDAKIKAKRRILKKERNEY